MDQMSGTTDVITAAAAVSASTVVAIVSDGDSLRTTNGEAAWAGGPASPIGEGVPAFVSWQDVSALPTGMVYAVGADSKIAVSSDGGVTWAVTTVGSDILYAVAAINATTALV